MDPVVESHCLHSSDPKSLQPQQNILPLQYVQLNQLIQHLCQHVQSAQPSSSNTLNITNGECRQRLHHGSQFKDLLDARDQVLEHPFDFHLPFNPKEVLRNDCTLTETYLYKRIYEKMQKFLVEAVSNVVSVAFRFLNRGEMTESDVKDYASKNILLNVHSVIRQTGIAISANPDLKFVKQQHLEEFRLHLLIDVEGHLKNILANLADGFPMALETGGSQKMRENIKAINRSDNEEYDLIFANKVSIKEHYSKEALTEDQGDYTKYIMEVLNTAIRTTQTCKQDARDRTYFQMFQQFNHKLQWAIKDDNFKSLLENTKDGPTVSGQKKPERLQTGKAKDLIAAFFDATLSTNNEQLKNIKEKPSKVVHPKEKANDGALKTQKLDQLFKQLLDNAEDPIAGIGSKQNTGKLKLGQKIPACVKLFTKQEMETKKFTAKHSSILRIMTKWSQYLLELFEDAEEVYTPRIYPIKTIENKLVILKNSRRGIQELIKRLKQEYKQVQKKFKDIKQSNYKFLSQLLGQDRQTNSNVARYSKTRSVASKVNAVLTNLMLQYLNVLIHHLLKAGQNLETNQGYADLNLVVLRVSDLMRSKIQCTQSGFVSVLKTFYLLDSHQDTEKKIKLVRIKNRLDSSANDIMINCMFMGRVQCELQLSIQESKGKEKNYYTFSHFIYELIRGKFGVIAELAIMISQLDPMITASQGDYYTEKKTSNLRPSYQKKEEQNHNHSKVKVKISESTYECNKCGRLVIGEAANFFEKDADVCNRCVISSSKPEERIKNKELKAALASLSDHKLTALSEINKDAHKKYLLILNEQGTLSLNMVIRMKNELKTFLLQLNSTIFEQITLKAALDFSSLSYFEAKDKDCINEPDNIFYLVYSCATIPSVIYKQIQVDRQFLQEHESIVIKQFTALMEEKNMVKTIKLNEEIINCTRDTEKWQAMNNVVRKLVAKQETNLLKYSENRHLDINLKHLVAQQCFIENMLQWFRECHYLTKLDLSYNKIKKVVKQELPLSLQQLDLFHNSLQQIDLDGLINLSSLSIGRNKLTRVDVGSLKNLIRISAPINMLKQIDGLKNLTNLTQLLLFNNQLTHIDVSNLNNIIHLDLSRNKLTTIILPVSFRLTTLKLHHNSLKQIDLSPVGEQLRQLLINNNRLKNIDVSKFTKITILTVHKNQLTELDQKTLNSRYNNQSNDMT